jgi:hypothetical protein
MTAEENRLLELVKNLDIENFKIEYNKHLDEFDSPEFCLITELYKHYPEINSKKELTDKIIKIRKKNEKIIQNFIDVIIQDSFCFENEVIKRKHDEIIKFNSLYESIGFEYTDFIDGNNIIHMQSAGLHFDGVLHMVNKNVDFNIYNGKGNNPLEVLFLESHTAFNDTDSSNIKKNIAILLKPLVVENNFREPNNLLYKAIDFQIKQDKINLDDLYLIINLYNINPMIVRLNISKYKKILLLNKSIFPVNAMSIIKKIEQNVL